MKISTISIFKKELLQYYTQKYTVLEFLKENRFLKIATMATVR